MPAGMNSMKIGTALKGSVAIRHTEVSDYPAFPYNPPRCYPEFRTWQKQTDPANRVYEAVRNILADMGLDRDNFNSPTWNPLREFIKRGQRALIKPNWVFHVNPLDGSTESLITHTSLIRAVVDYLILALDREGIIEIADAPLQGCDFNELLRKNRIMELIGSYRERFPNVEISVFDLRKIILHGGRNRIAGLEKQSEQAGDPRGYTLIDLGQESLLVDIQDRFERFRVTMYDHRIMHEHHNLEKHEYLVSNSVLSSDFILNLPKLKCHNKAGITGALKNLVGINGHKEYLPHHTNGCPATGGDQYQHNSYIKPLINGIYDEYWSNLGNRGKIRNTLSAFMIRACCQLPKLLDKDRMLEGGWSGNDTIPRTTLDLNHVLYYYDSNTRGLLPTVVRNVLHIVDGVVAGEGYGPLRPTSKRAGVVLGGFNPLLIDACGAKLIGFDPMKIRLLRYGFVHAKSRFSVPISTSCGTMIMENGISTEFEKLPNLEFSIMEEWKDATIRPHIEIPHPSFN